MPLPHCRSWAMNACCLMRLLGLIQHQHQLHLQKAEIKVNTKLAMNRRQLPIIDRKRTITFRKNSYIYLQSTNCRPSSH